MDFTPRIFVYSLVVESLALLCLGQLENLGMLALMGGGTMGGMGGMGGMGAGLGIGGGMTPAEFAILDNAVKTIVGPHASPDVALINYATQQGGSPRGFMQVMGYIPFFQNIARRVGIRPVPGETMTTITAQNADNIVMQRAIRWSQGNGILMSAGMGGGIF